MRARALLYRSEILLRASWSAISCASKISELNSPGTHYLIAPPASGAEVSRQQMALATGHPLSAARAARVGSTCLLLEPDLALRSGSCLEEPHPQPARYSVSGKAPDSQRRLDRPGTSDVQGRVFS